MRIAELGTPFAEKTVVALGFFDSIHIGHRDIIAKTIGKARAFLPSAAAKLSG